MNFPDTPSIESIFREKMLKDILTTYLHISDPSPNSSHAATLHDGAPVPSMSNPAYRRPLPGTNPGHPNLFNVDNLLTLVLRGLHTRAVQPLEALLLVLENGRSL